MSVERSQVFADLVDFVTTSFMVTVDEIDMDESLIDQGIIDSFGLVEITSFIETEYGLTIHEREMTREAFGSMNKMATFIARRLNEES